MEQSFLPMIVAFAWASLFMLLGVVLRAKVKIFQQMLLPAALIGGIVGFICMSFGIVGIPTTNGWYKLDPATYSLIAFHLFGFSFTGLGLLESKQRGGAATKSIVRGSLWLSLVFSLCFAVQGVTGFSIFSIWKNMFGGDFSPLFGYLFPGGFTQGPGQALGYANVWLSAQPNFADMQHAAATGLAFAAAGFVVSGVVGVIFANYGIKKGWQTFKDKEVNDEFRSGLFKPENRPSCSTSTIHTANMDNMSFHFALCLFTYGLAFLFSVGWFILMPAALKPMAFAMVFIWALFMAMIVKVVLKKLGLMQYVDPDSIRRVTGFSVDYMITTVFLGISVTALQAVLVPFVLTVVIGTILTFIVVLTTARRLPEYGFERALGGFGQCTGTGASALLLLRIVDPDFETTVAVEAGMQNAWSMLFFQPISLATTFAYSLQWGIWVFVGYLFLMPALMFVFRLISLKRQF